MNLLHAAAISGKNKEDKLRAFSEEEFLFGGEDILIEKRKKNTYVKIPLEKGEQIYGLGLQFKSVNRRGKLYHLSMDHYGGKDNGRTHAPVPFYVSSKGYGLLIHTPSPISIYVGTGLRVDSSDPPPVYDRNTDKNWDPQPPGDVIEILIPDAEAELVLFQGSSAMEVVQKYNLYQGGGVLPPKWGLGFTYRTHTKYSAKEVEAEVDAFEEKGFPLDFIGLEPGWMTQSYPCTFEWDTGRFPQPKDFVQNLKNKGVRINLWMNPYIAPQGQLYTPMKAWSGTHTVWNGIVPDYTLETPYNLFQDFIDSAHIAIGVSGYKIDETDGYDNWLWPDVATFPSGIDALELRQMYGLLMQSMVYEVYREKNERTYGLTRASNAGAAPLPFVIYNDYYKHEDFITALINSGFSGLLWTPEARNSPTGEEWLRRMQAVCFSPMAMINAWASGTRPWSYPEVYEAVQDVAILRMRLLPYIYSTFALYEDAGIPPIRPMPLLEGFVSDLKANMNPYEKATRSDIKDQYMFGENLLVAPVFAGQKKRKVILPAGKWFDFYTGDFVGAGEIIEVETQLDRIPLYVKDGGIIPMIPARLHAPRSEENLPLEIRHFGNAPGSFILYDDDGTSFDFEQGEYSRTSLSVSLDPTETLRGEIQRLEGSWFSYENISWTFMTLSKN